MFFALLLIQWGIVKQVPIFMAMTTMEMDIVVIKGL